MKKKLNIIEIGFGSDGEYYESIITQINDELIANNLKKTIDGNNFQKILIVEEIKEDETISKYHNEKYS